ncbi:hypothetical protein WICMUC_002638 [Wickerhamomyces mucosus]|uniref:Uncharacterized protein n=1 Tax=Wickerhamomyces mucosus TaxID=1378264 RepID=A0A9P8PQ85_9ASCO|nr:hypothetical protein WICMUC_002638 [Wickerhamomyces mucosus]
MGIPIKEILRSKKNVNNKRVRISDRNYHVPPSLIRRLTINPPVPIELTRSNAIRRRRRFIQPLHTNHPLPILPTYSSNNRRQEEEEADAEVEEEAEEERGRGGGIQRSIPRSSLWREHHYPEPYESVDSSNDELNSRLLIPHDIVDNQQTHEDIEIDGMEQDHEETMQLDEYNQQQGGVPSTEEEAINLWSERADDLRRRLIEGFNSHLERGEDPSNNLANINNGYRRRSINESESDDQHDLDSNNDNNYNIHDNASDGDIGERLGTRIGGRHEEGFNFFGRFQNRDRRDQYSHNFNNDYDYNNGNNENNNESNERVESPRYDSIDRFLDNDIRNNTVDNSNQRNNRHWNESIRSSRIRNPNRHSIVFHQPDIIQFNSNNNNNNDEINNDIELSPRNI